MKISIKELRQLVRETIKELTEATDKDLTVGDRVNVLVNGQAVEGTIRGTIIPGQDDPLAKGNVTSKLHKTLWTVEANGRVHQFPAEDIKLVRSVKTGDMTKSDKPIWKTDTKYTTNTSEASTTASRKSMMLNSDYNEGSKDAAASATILDDEAMYEADESWEAENFGDHKYDIIAKQLVFKWEDRTPEVTWKTVTKNYANAQQQATGKQVDVEKLYKAILRYLETDGDTRNQNVFSGTHLCK